MIRLSPFLLVLSGTLAAAEPQIQIAFIGQAQHDGPVLVGVSASAEGSAYRIQDAPYLIVVRLGDQVRYVYPPNAIFPQVTDPPTAAHHWSRALFRYRPGASYPAELHVDAIFADGTRLSRTEPIPYEVVTGRVDMATQYRASLEDCMREVEKRRNAPEYPGRTRDLCVSYRLLLWTTLDRESASRVWSEARALIGPTEGLSSERREWLDALQQSQLDGAIKRNDLATQRTLITERERLGFEVKAYHYMNLMSEMVTLDNDVEGARQLWPKLVESYRRNPEGHSKSYEGYVIQGPRLPLSRIDPDLARDRTRLHIAAELQDEDAFTPADRAQLQLRLDSGAAMPDLQDVLVRLEIVGEPAASQAAPGLLLATKGDPSTKIQFRIEHLAPGESVPLTARISSAAESNEWIRDRLIAANEFDQQKPERENSVALTGCVHVRVEGRRADGSQAVLLDQDLVVRSSDGAPAAITYPDLRQLAGLPPARESREYYRVGDPDYSLCGDPVVREIALRAARYDHEHLSSEGRQFPENDAETVARNMAWFVYDAFQPKSWPEPIWTSAEIARQVRDGVLDPGKKFSFPGKKGMACIEHAYFYGALLRAVGIPAREINCIAHPIVWSYTGQFFQDASSEAFYQAAADPAPRWHYFSLFNTAGRPIEDPGERYASRFSVFELWVGSRTWNLVAAQRQNRFLMSPDEMATSRVWKPYGYGGGGLVSGEGFWRRSDERWGWPGWFGSYWSFRFFSPVAARVELADGRTVGVTGEVDVEAVARWYAGGGADPSPPGVTCNVPGAFYFPEGMVLADGSATGETATPMAQTIVIPAAAAEAGFRLELVGTGTGPFRVEAAHVTPDGVQEHEALTGTVQPGTRVSYGRADLRSTGPRQWPALRGAAGSPDTGAGAAATATAPPVPSSSVPAVSAPGNPADPASPRLPASQPGTGTPTPAAGQADRPPWLGAHVVDPQGATAGSLVEEVVDASPAGRGGLMPGDLITHANRTPVRDSAHLVRLVAAGKAGDRLTLGIVRAGTVATAVVVLEQRPLAAGATPVLQPRGPTAPSATIRRVWLEYGVLDSEGRGMVVHAHLRASGLRGRELEFLATFADVGGKAVAGARGHRTTSGQAVTVARATAIYDDTEWQDYPLFMPYWALTLAAGERHTLQVTLHVRESGSAESLATGEPASFQLTRSANPMAAIIQQIDVTYDQQNLFERGLGFSVDLEVHGRRGQEVGLMVSFLDASGQTLRDSNGRYATTAGEVATSQQLTPQLDATSFTDTLLYIPYAELHLARGVHELSYIVHVHDTLTGEFVARTPATPIRVTVP